MIFRYKQEVCFHDVSVKWRETWRDIANEISVYVGFRFTIGAFFRLLIGELLKEEIRAIYLDADTVVNMDIEELRDKKWLNKN